MLLVSMELKSSICGPQWKVHQQHTRRLVISWCERSVDANSRARKRLDTRARAKKGSTSNINRVIEGSEESYLSLFEDTQKYLIRDDEQSSVDPDGDFFIHKAGRKKGFKQDPQAIAKIKKAMKGKNTSKKSTDHKNKISTAMLEFWEKRRQSGKQVRSSTVKCSVCGKKGHNRRTCPS